MMIKTPHARMCACVCSCMQGYLHIRKVYKHADQYANMYACMNTCRHIQPDMKAVISARFTMIEHDDQNLYTRMHASMCSCVDDHLHVSKGVQAYRPA